MNLQACYHAYIEWSPTYAFEVAECVGAGSLVDDVSLGKQQQIIEELVDGVAGLMNREDYCAVVPRESTHDKLLCAQYLQNSIFECYHVQF